jgi:ADP-ribose pyrophosphatase YjhB (NUDIX family)
VISFDSEGVRFNYRVAGIVIEGGRVLLSRADWEDFWYLPGGRVEMREEARESLSREMAEELGTTVEIGRLVWVLENFFEFDGTPFHEIGMYFDASLPDASPAIKADEFERDDEGTRLIFRWVRVDELGDLRLLPAFLVQGLREIPEETAHVVWRDDEPLRRA